MNSRYLSYNRRFNPRTVGRMAAIACAALAIGFACQSVVAAAESPPDPPLVGPAPDPGAWTIEVKQKKAPPPPPSDPNQAAAYKRALEIYPRTVRVAVEKSGKDRFQETSYDNGKTGVIYLYKGWVVYRPMEWPADKALALPAGYRDSPVKGGLGPDFPDVAWIQPAFFVKTVTYHGQSCHYYEDKEAPPLTGGDTLNPNPSKGVRAWIDAKTRLPVAVEDDAVLKKFHFPKEAPASIELTGVFAAAYKARPAVSFPTK